MIHQLNIKAQTMRSEAQYLLQRAVHDVTGKVPHSLRFADGVRAIASLPELLPNVSRDALQRAVRAKLPHHIVDNMLDSSHDSNQALLTSMAEELALAVNRYWPVPRDAGT
jgi:hypothetical protein